MNAPRTLPICFCFFWLTMAPLAASDELRVETKAVDVGTPSVSLLVNLENEGDITGFAFKLQNSTPETKFAFLE
ncbi:MAG: hypothetical protein V3T77_08795, partial [Planctomycetota bacterium]